MEKIIIKFGDIETGKQKFHQQERPVSIKYIDINKIVAYNKTSLAKKRFKYFIGYSNAKIRHLCIFPPRMKAYRGDFGETKYMSFLIKDDQLSEKYNEIWGKVGKAIKKKNLIVNLFTTKNVQKLKQNLIREKFSQ